MKFKKLMASILVATTAFSFTACGSKPKTYEGPYKAGTYTVETEGHNGKIVVDVTFEETKISKIEIKEHVESAGICDVPFTKLPEQIVENQTLKLDTVSGATYSSNAVLNAVAKAAQEAGGDVEKLKSADPLAKDDKKENVTKTADVIVVGGGLAGLASSVSAAEEGATVILVEKNPFLGGNSIRTGGGYAAVDTEISSKHKMTDVQMKEIEAHIAKETDNETVKSWQEKVKSDMDEYKKNKSTHLYDSIEFTALQFYFRFGAVADAELLYDMVEKSKPMKDWIAGYGFPWVDQANVIVGDNWQRWYVSGEHKGGDGFIQTLENAIKEKDLKVEIIKETAAKELIMKDKAVVGVKAKGNDGTKYTLNANKGVVLSSGGFAGNKELIKKYNDGRWPELTNINTTNDPSNTGDGIIMGTNAGADVTDMGHLQILPIADPENGDTKTFLGSTTGLYINKDGKRFVDETKDRDTMVKAILDQKDGETYIISSSENVGIDKNGLNVMGRLAEDLIKAGKVIKADTLDELAEKIGVDKAVLNETVTKFNKATETGVDNEFGRVSFAGDITNPNGTPAIGNGPYYACLRVPAAHITKGGLKVNKDAEVISTVGTPIKGLYAAGEVTGGRTVAGLLEALTSGHTAGKSITK